jgi:hypothetical protein
MGFREKHIQVVLGDLFQFSGLKVRSRQVYNHLRKCKVKWMKVCNFKHLREVEWLNET